MIFIKKIIIYIKYSAFLRKIFQFFGEWSAQVQLKPFLSSLTVDPPSGGKFLHFAIIFYSSSCQPEDGLYGGRRDKTGKED